MFLNLGSTQVIVSRKRHFEDGIFEDGVMVMAPSGHCSTQALHISQALISITLDFFSRSSMMYTPRGQTS